MCLSRLNEHTQTHVHTLVYLLTVEGCLGEEGQESESGELCLLVPDSYKPERGEDRVVLVLLINRREREDRK